jgi:hypothetical protein
MYLRTPIVLLLAASTVCGQEKVGTIDGIEYLSPSVRAAGMGFVGSVLTDYQSCHYNAGVLAFGDWEHAAASGFPVVTNLFGDPLYRSNAFGGAVKRSDVGVPVVGRIDIAGAYQYLRSRMGPLYETGQSSGDPVRVFTWKDDAHEVTLSAAHRSKLDLGVGVTCRYVASSTSESSGSEHSFSTGVFARAHVIDMIPSWRRALGDGIKLTALAGLSLNNYGEDIVLYASDSGVRTVSAGYEQPRNRRIGLGFSLSYETSRLKWVELAPAYEQEADLTGDLHTKTNKYGVEAGICEALSLRAGVVDLPHEADDLSTCGASLSSRGMWRLLSDSRDTAGSDSLRTRESLWAKLDIVLTFATVSPDGLLRKYRNDYWCITVSL